MKKMKKEKVKLIYYSNKLNAKSKKFKNQKRFESYIFRKNNLSKGDKIEYEEASDFKNPQTLNHQTLYNVFIYHCSIIAPSYFYFDLKDKSTVGSVVFKWKGRKND